MFTENVKARPRGRPRGQTAQGVAAKQRLYDVAIDLFTTDGYETTTLRDVAKEAGVSVGLLYRYFPNKRAVIVQLYDELSAEYSKQAAAMTSGTWRYRFLFALRTSLRVLQPHRAALRALVPVLVGDPDEGLFARGTAFSRLRVQRVFEEAVTQSTDAPARVGPAVGRLLYLAHLAVLLWWLLDRSAKQHATTSLVNLIEQVLPSAALALRIPGMRRFVGSLDALIGDALFEPSTAG